MRLTRLLAVCLACSLIGCGGNAPEESGNSQAGKSTPQNVKKSGTQTGQEKARTQDKKGGAVSILKKKSASGKKSGYAAKKQKTPFRERLFEGWGKPEFAFFFTGQQRGYIEPCGCTGLASQKGGLMRRDTFLQELTQRGWNPLALDVGNQVRRTVRQAEIKFGMTAEALKKMNYRAVAFGAQDVQLSFGELAAAVDPENPKSPFICANVHLLDTAPEYRIIQQGSRKIGVTAVMSDRFAQSIISDIIEVEPAAKALARVIKKLQSEKCDVMVLLAQASLRETKELVKGFSQFDLIVTSGGAEEPAYEPERLSGKEALLIQIGGKGMYAGVVGYFPGKKPVFRYQRAPLDARFKDSQRMFQLFLDYQDQLKRLYPQGLEVRPRPHSSGNRYVGSAKCQDCHPSAYDVWKKSKHAHGTDSLIHPRERAQIARHYDPECLSCHVTGWNAQKYEPYSSGYLKLKTSTHLKGSGCENCHGPASNHVKAEENDLDDETKQRYRKMLALPLDKAERKCLECHDLDNSPDFHVKGAFMKYWKKVEHTKD